MITQGQCLSQWFAILDHVPQLGWNRAQKREQREVVLFVEVALQTLESQTSPDAAIRPRIREAKGPESSICAAHVILCV